MRKNLKILLTSKLTPQFIVPTVLFVQFWFGETLQAWAETGAPAGGGGAAPAPQQPGFGAMLFPFALMFAVVYFLMIRPQQKRMKQQQEMLGGLKSGDEVVTTSGILGTVSGLTDKVVTIEVADNVRIKMLKSQIAQVVKGNIKDLDEGSLARGGR